MAQRGQKGLAPVPRQPLCHTPTLWFCCLLSLRGHPGNLCSSPAAPACSNSHLSQLVNLAQKWSREGGHRQTAPGSCSEPHPSTLTTGMSSLPSTISFISLCQQHLPAQGRSSSTSKGKQEPGGSPRAQIPPGAHIKLSLSTGDLLELPLGAAVRLQDRYLLTREILGTQAAGLALGVQHRVTLRTAKEAPSPAGSKLRNRRWGDHSSAPNPQMSLSFYSFPGKWLLQFLSGTANQTQGVASNCEEKKEIQVY